MRNNFLKSKLTEQLQVQSGAIRKTNVDDVAIAAAASKPPTKNLQPDYELVTRKVSQLKVSTHRVRKTGAAQLRRVITSIQAHGMVPILISHDDEVVDGHIVLEAALKLGLKEIRCLVAPHLSQTTLRSLRIALNRIGESGEWDLEMLKLEMIELEELQIDLTVTGFTLPEIDIIKRHEEKPVKKAPGEPDVKGVPVSQPGDLFALGEHRLLCGDSLADESYTTLLEDKKVACVFSDPPYNCKIEGFVGGLGRSRQGFCDGGRRDGRR